MRIRRSVLAVGIGALAVGAAAILVRGADHGDAPGVRVNTRLDINDVYAFRSPADSSHTVLIMTVSPLAGITGATTFPRKAITSSRSTPTATPSKTTRSG